MNNKIKKTVGLFFMSLCYLTVLAQKPDNTTETPENSKFALKTNILSFAHKNIVLEGEYQFHRRFSVVAAIGLKRVKENYDYSRYDNLFKQRGIAAGVGVKYYPFRKLASPSLQGFAIRVSANYKYRNVVGYDNYGEEGWEDFIPPHVAHEIIPELGFTYQFSIGKAILIEPQLGFAPFWGYIIQKDPQSHPDHLHRQWYYAELLPSYALNVGIRF